MEHSETDIDVLRFDHKEADSRMFVYFSYAMELYSPGLFVIWNIVQATLMPGDMTMKKQIRECLYIFHMAGIIFNGRSCYMEHSQTNIDALRSDHEERDLRMFAHVSHAMELYSIRSFGI